MNVKIKKILSGLLLTSIAGISNASQDSQNALLESNFESERLKSKLQNQSSNLKKYILKFGQNNAYNIIAHRSHRSHSSHRSHYSHYSSRTGHVSHYSSSNYPVKNTKTKVSKVITTEKASSYSFGDRIIKKGMTGKDVNCLINLLIKYGYLKQYEIKINSKGYIICNERVVKGIIHFQKDALIKADGQVGEKTIEKILNWTEYKKYRLGLRSLSIGCSGDDVKSLALILIKLDYLKISEVFTNSEGKAIYTNRIKIAVAAFQKEEKLSITGVADLLTINELKTKFNNEI